MLILLKIWSWVKSYWYVPLLVILGIVLLLSGNGLGKVADILKNARDSHKRELDKINEEHAKEIKARDEALKKHQETLEAIEKQYKEAQGQLDAQKKKEIQKIVSETKDDPEELARRLSEVTGFRVILPSD